MTRKNFTLVEIMIVVAIIGLLAAIAIPSFVKARDTSRANACINNLRQIDGAKEQYAIASDVASGAITWDNISSYLKASPKCKASGAYTVGNVGANPTCSYSGTPSHVLP